MIPPPLKRVAGSTRSIAAALLLLAGVMGIANWHHGARAETPQRFISVTTPKGLAFQWRYDDTTPFAALHFGLRDIYALTTPGKVGLTSLGGTLILQGADGAGQNEFAERMRDLSASGALSIGPFTTSGNVRAPGATLAPAVALFADALKTAAPSAKLLERLRQRSEGGEAQTITRAETIAERAALLFALGDHPVTRSFDPSRFGRIGADDISEWRARNLDRSKLRIAASGRVEQADAARIIDDAFAGLPADLPTQRFSWPAISIPAATIVIEHETAQSAVLLVGMTSLSGGREVETANVANAILGGGANGRLWQAVRAGLGATYGASSGLQVVAPNQRILSLRASIANDQVKASVDTLKSAYAEFVQRGVTEAELKSTASRFASDLKSALDDPSRANGIVLSLLMAGRSVEDMYSYESRLNALDRAQLATFIAQKFPQPEKLLRVIVTPSAAGLEASCVVHRLDDVATCRKN